jgi:hypothetical protein
VAAQKINTFLAPGFLISHAAPCLMQNIFLFKEWLEKHIISTYSYK